MLKTRKGVYTGPRGKLPREYRCLVLRALGERVGVEKHLGVQWLKTSVVVGWLTS